MYFYELMECIFYELMGCIFYELMGCILKERQVSLKLIEFILQCLKLIECILRVPGVQHTSRIRVCVCVCVEGGYVSVMITACCLAHHLKQRLV